MKQPTQGQSQRRADPMISPDASRQVDRSGEAIINMLRQAAEAAEAECARAMEAAHQYAMQLRASEDRAEKLRLQVEYLEQRAIAAENWMQRIQGEIEEKFLRQRPAERRMAS